jgi:transcriptional regulator with XRE-family HTH domain
MDESEKKIVLKDLANRIKRLRKEKGLSQEDAYNDTGIHFARIEQGRRDTSYTTLYRICLYFNISLKDFFNDLKN